MRTNVVVALVIVAACFSNCFAQQGAQPRGMLDQPPASRTSMVSPTTTQHGAINAVAVAKLLSGAVVKSTGQVSNPAIMNSPMLLTLQQQKQAADIEVGQIMSAPGGSAGAGAAALNRPGMTTAARPLMNGGTPSKPGMLTAQPSSVICMANTTGIRTVNQKTTGVVFTPDSRYNLYTITGCNFGSSPGKIYLQGNGAFPAHGGKLMLTPVDPTRGWKDTAIIAKLDPNIVGELDQDNISLVVETSTGQRGQANGFSFYAVRGPAYPLKQIPASAACTTGGDSSPNAGCSPGTLGAFDGAFATPCHPLWSETVLNDCTIKIYRDGPIIDEVVTGAGHAFTDKFAPKLKPGFILSAAMVQISTLRENQGDVLNPYMLKFSGNQVVVTEQAMRKSAPAQDHFFVFYGVTLWVYGPAGISDPLAN